MKLPHYMGKEISSIRHSLFQRSLCDIYFQKQYVLYYRNWHFKRIFQGDRKFDGHWTLSRRHITFEMYDVILKMTVFWPYMCDTVARSTQIVFSRKNRISLEMFFSSLKSCHFAFNSKTLYIFQVAEQTFENNAAVCALDYTQQYARIYNCSYARP